MNAIRFTLAVAIGIATIAGLAEAQNELTLGAKNPVVVDGPRFIPFSADSSALIDSAMERGFSVSQCRATAIKGSDLEVGPAAAGSEIGDRRKVKKKKKKKGKPAPQVVCDLDFSGGLSMPPGSRYGISVVGKGSFTLDLAEPGNCASPITCEADENSARKCSTATNQKCCEADSNGNLLKKCKSNGKKCVCAK